MAKRTARQLRDQRIPHGRNKMGAREIFTQRKLYKNTYHRLRNTIDFWYRDTLYGRIDQEGNAIYPQEKWLKEFRTASGCSLYAFNFVVEAYERFVNTFASRNMRNPIFKDEKYLFPQGLLAKKAWINSHQMYHDITDAKYKKFVKEYLSNKQTNKQIVNFDTFMTSFLSFLGETGTIVPFTKTGVLTSLGCTPNVSALCVEFSLARYGEDLIKHDGFMTSPFFRDYISTAEHHGFRIDVNAPWRLVADITSPEMGWYMAKYGVTQDNIYDTCYLKSYTYEIPTLKTYLRQIYNSFVASQPSFRTGKNTTLRRRRISEEVFDRKYDDSYWVRTYAKIRRTEVLDKYSDERFKEILGEAQNLRITLDMNAAIVYINRQFLGQLTPTV